MREPKYVDVPAARHMRVPVSGAEHSGAQPQGAPDSPKDIAGPGPVRTPDASRPDSDASYRRKRLVAGALTGLVFLSVPVLVTLLVFFG